MTAARARNFGQLVTANRRRTKIAAGRQVADAKRAIRIMEKLADQPVAELWDNCHATYQRALMLRIAHPTASLAEIAAVQRISKDTYSARLRRAFRYAAKFDTQLNGQEAMSVETLINQLAASEQWMVDAICPTTSPDDFFPNKGESTKEAKRICLGCPVRAECLSYALRNDERFGVWGGLSERERRALVRTQDGLRTYPVKLCVHGHDITEVGRTLQGHCRACRISYEERRRRDRAAS